MASRSRKSEAFLAVYEKVEVHGKALLGMAECKDDRSMQFAGKDVKAFLFAEDDRQEPESESQPTVAEKTNLVGKPEAGRGADRIARLSLFSELNRPHVLELGYFDVKGRTVDGNTEKEWSEVMCQYHSIGGIGSGPKLSIHDIKRLAESENQKWWLEHPIAEGTLPRRWRAACGFLAAVWSPTVVLVRVVSLTSGTKRQGDHGIPSAGGVNNGTAIANATINATIA